MAAKKFPFIYSPSEGTVPESGEHGIWNVPLLNRSTTSVSLKGECGGIIFGDTEQREQEFLRVFVAFRYLNLEERWRAFAEEHKSDPVRYTRYKWLDTVFFPTASHIEHGVWLSVKESTDRDLAIHYHDSPMREFERAEAPFGTLRGASNADLGTVNQCSHVFKNFSDSPDERPLFFPGLPPLIYFLLSFTTSCIFSISY